MVCIYCGEDTQVINSRPQKNQNQIWRRRRCTECRALLTTEEAIVYRQAVLIKQKDGNLEPYSRDRLFISILNSCRHRSTAVADAAGLTATVQAKLIPAQLTAGALDRGNVIETVKAVLENFDNAAAVHYAAFHA